MEETIKNLRNHLLLLKSGIFGQREIAIKALEEAIVFMESYEYSTEEIVYYND